MVGPGGSARFLLWPTQATHDEAAQRLEAYPPNTCEGGRDAQPATSETTPDSDEKSSGGGDLRQREGRQPDARQHRERHAQRRDSGPGRLTD